jgi:hypothetical protein
LHKLCQQTWIAPQYMLTNSRNRFYLEVLQVASKINHTPFVKFVGSSLQLQWPDRDCLIFSNKIFLQIKGLQLHRPRTTSCQLSAIVVSEHIWNDPGFTEAFSSICIVKRVSTGHQVQFAGQV